MITQHTATKIRILRVVFLKIRLFRLHFVPRAAREPARFPITFWSLLFWMIFVHRQKKSRSIHRSKLMRCAGG